MRRWTPTELSQRARLDVADAAGRARSVAGYSTRFALHAQLHSRPVVSACRQTLLRSRDSRLPVKPQLTPPQQSSVAKRLRPSCIVSWHSPWLTQNGSEASDKVPGGKLEQVQFGIVDGNLHEVVVTGHFLFLILAEEALPVLSFAIEGASATEDRDARARIAEAIPNDVELVGASPEALAIAVERGLHPPDPLFHERHDTGTTGPLAGAGIAWKSIPGAPTQPLLLALDEVLAAGLGRASAPASRIWGWSRPCIVLGRFQSDG